MSQYDVIIIGAGPGGIFAAYELVKDAPQLKIAVLEAGNPLEGASFTSNLDSLNESIILRSLKKMGKDKTVILVSHRESTMAVAEKVYQMENGRIS